MSRKTTKGIDPAADVTRRSVIIIDSSRQRRTRRRCSLSGPLNRMSGPEAVTTTVNEYKLQALLVAAADTRGSVSACGNAVYLSWAPAWTSFPNSQELDKLFAGMNERNCELKGFARMGTYFHRRHQPHLARCKGVHDHQGGRSLPAAPSPRTGPLRTRGCALTAYPRFTASAPPRATRGPPREIDLGSSGRGEDQRGKAVPGVFPRSPGRWRSRLPLRVQGAADTVRDQRGPERSALPARTGGKGR